MDKAYYKASDVLRGTVSSTDIQRMVARLYYYSNPREQDAFACEYYDELMHGGQYLKETEMDRRIAEYEALCRWYEDNRNSEDIAAAVAEYREFGMPKRNFETMIASGLKRLKKKKKNIEKHFADEMRMVKENRIHIHGTTHKYGINHLF